MGEWQIKIVDPGYTIERNIYIFRRLPSGKSEILGVGEVEMGSYNPEPTLKLNPEQLQAFANALNDTGFKPQAGFMEGKLEGTERHLADLRQLMKLK